MHCRHGKAIPKRTTKGWKMCVKWKDQSTSWVDLRDLKESNPIETAEYAVANEIDHLPDFAWWVRQPLKKKKNRILKKMVKNTTTW